MAPAQTFRRFNNGGSANRVLEWCVGCADTNHRMRDGLLRSRIPFYTLKYRPGEEEQVWGINFERNIRRNRQQARWQGWQRNYDISDVSQAGLLKGLTNLRDKRFIEIKPYGLAWSLKTMPDGN